MTILLPKYSDSPEFDGLCYSFDADNFPNSDSSFLNIVPTLYGPAQSVTTTNGAYIRSKLVKPINVAELSIMWYGYVNAFTAYSDLFSLGNVASDIVLEVQTSPQFSPALYNINYGTGGVSGTSTYQLNGTWACIIARASATLNLCEIFVQGVSLGTSTWAGSGTATLATISNRSTANGSRTGGGLHMLAHAWNRFLKNSEVINLSRNPRYLLLKSAAFTSIPTAAPTGNKFISLPPGYTTKSELDPVLNKQTEPYYAFNHDAPLRPAVIQKSNGFYEAPKDVHFYKPKGMLKDVVKYCWNYCGVGNTAFDSINYRYASGPSSSSLNATSGSETFLGKNVSGNGPNSFRASTTTVYPITAIIRVFPTTTGGWEGCYFSSGSTTNWIIVSGSSGSVTLSLKGNTSTQTISYSVPGGYVGKVLTIAVQVISPTNYKLVVDGVITYGTTDVGDLAINQTWGIGRNAGSNSGVSFAAFGDGVFLPDAALQELTGNGPAFWTNFGVANNYSSFPQPRPFIKTTKTSANSISTQPIAGAKLNSYSRLASKFEAAYLPGISNQNLAAKPDSGSIVDSARTTIPLDLNHGLSWHHTTTNSTVTTNEFTNGITGYPFFLVWAGKMYGTGSNDFILGLTGPSHPGGTYAFIGGGSSAHVVFNIRNSFGSALTVATNPISGGTFARPVIIIAQAVSSTSHRIAVSGATGIGSISSNAGSIPTTYNKLISGNSGGANALSISFMGAGKTLLSDEEMLWMTEDISNIFSLFSVSKQYPSSSVTTDSGIIVPPYLRDPSISNITSTTGTPIVRVDY